eukprot:1739209-Amphidinium_carterae.1
MLVKVLLGRECLPILVQDSVQSLHEQEDDSIDTLKCKQGQRASQREAKVAANVHMSLQALSWRKLLG